MTVTVYYKIKEKNLIFFEDKTSIMKQNRKYLKQ